MIGHWRRERSVTDRSGSTDLEGHFIEVFCHTGANSRDTISAPCTELGGIPLLADAIVIRCASGEVCRQFTHAGNCQTVEAVGRSRCRFIATRGTRSARRPGVT